MKSKNGDRKGDGYDGGGDVRFGEGNDGDRDGGERVDGVAATVWLRPKMRDGGRKGRGRVYSGVLSK